MTINSKKSQIVKTFLNYVVTIDSSKIQKEPLIIFKNSTYIIIFFFLTRSLLHDPHVGHADYAPSAGDPPETHSFNFDNV